MKPLSNAPWPPDPDEVERHDHEADPKRDEQGLPYPSRQEFPMTDFFYLDNQGRPWSEQEALVVGLDLSAPMQKGLEDLYRGEIHVRSRNSAQTERALRNRGLITTGRSRPCILTDEGKAVRQALRNHRR